MFSSKENKELHRQKQNKKKSAAEKRIDENRLKEDKTSLTPDRSGNDNFLTKIIVSKANRALASARYQAKKKTDPSQPDESNIFTELDDVAAADLRKKILMCSTNSLLSDRSSFPLSNRYNENTSNICRKAAQDGNEMKKYVERKSKIPQLSICTSSGITESMSEDSVIEKLPTVYLVHSVDTIMSSATFSENNNDSVISCPVEEKNSSQFIDFDDDSHSINEDDINMRHYYGVKDFIQEVNPDMKDTKSSVTCVEGDGINEELKIPCEEGNCQSVNSIVPQELNSLNKRERNECTPYRFPLRLKADLKLTMSRFLGMDRKRRPQNSLQEIPQIISLKEIPQLICLQKIPQLCASESYSVDKYLSSEDAQSKEIECSFSSSSFDHPASRMHCSHVYSEMGVETVLSQDTSPELLSTGCTTLFP